MIRIYTEASGSLTAAYLINSIREAGYFCIASDIVTDCAGKYLADDYVIAPAKDDPDFWTRMQDILQQMRVDVVIPSLDETLVEWARKKPFLLEDGIRVVLSDSPTIEICQDKWLTYNFFKDNQIPTPSTNLEQRHPLVKPRFGRGGKGILITSDRVDMTGMISQQIVSGTEYTVDVLCDGENSPQYIVPRKRLDVRDGKSTGGIVVKHAAITGYVEKICSKLPFIGPINIQCFENPEGNLYFTEINPRIAGGMALSFAATENWISIIVDNLMSGKKIAPRATAEGMQMRRYYAEVFFS